MPELLSQSRTLFGTDLPPLLGLYERRHLIDHGRREHEDHFLITPLYNMQAERSESAGYSDGFNPDRQRPILPPRIDRAELARDLLAAEAFHSIRVISAIVDNPIAGSVLRLQVDQRHGGCPVPTFVCLLFLPRAVLSRRALPAASFFRRSLARFAFSRYLSLSAASPLVGRLSGLSS
jgi:hypothetical protein